MASPALGLASSPLAPPSLGASSLAPASLVRRPAVPSPQCLHNSAS
jgi:hypothetical protein